MKVKLKFDKAAILGFLVGHGEKIAFGLFVLFFILFCYGAFKQKPYTKRPEEFTKKAAEVGSLVSGSTFQPDNDIPPVDDPPEAHPIAEHMFVTRKEWSRPLVDDGQRRLEPAFLAASELEVGADYGAISVITAPGNPAPPVAPAPAAKAVRAPSAKAKAPEPGGLTGGLMGGLTGGLSGAAAQRQAGDANAGQAGGKPPSGGQAEGRQWAVVTGLIPLEKQSREYHEAFKNARNRDSHRDHPNFVSFEVERAEVNPSSDDPAEPKWAVLDSKALLAPEANYAATAPDQVDAVYLEPNVCRRLPLLLGKAHAKSVVHSKIPILNNLVAAPAANAPAATPVAATPAGSNTLTGGLTGGLMGGLTGGLSGGAAAATAPRENSTGTATDVAAPKVEYQMLRFFDYSVVPGKSYRYRVKLVLENPNHGMQPWNVANAKFVQGETRSTGWSEKSPIVTISRGLEVLAGPSKKAKPGLAESKADVLVRVWDRPRAVDALLLKEIVRGQVANFAKESVNLTMPPDSKIVTQPVDFETGKMLVDLRGGDTIEGAMRTRAPTRLLVMEPNGELTVRSELGDLEAYQADRHRIDDMEAQNPRSTGPRGARTETAADAADAPKKKEKDKDKVNDIFGLGGAGPAGKKK